MLRRQICPICSNQIQLCADSIGLVTNFYTDCECGAFIDFGVDKNNKIIINRSRDKHLNKIQQDPPYL